MKRSIDVKTRRSNVTVSPKTKTVQAHGSRPTLDAQRAADAIDANSIRTLFLEGGSEESVELIASVYGTGDTYVYALYPDRILRRHLQTKVVEIATNATDFSPTGSDWVGREQLTYEVAS